MLKEIGSNFWLNPSETLIDVPLGTPVQFNCKGEDFVWLSSGRSSIKYVINDIENKNQKLKKVAVLPSFTCNTVFEPFLKAGYKVYYYPVNKDLTISSDAILDTVYKYDASIVLFHRYFGFNTLDNQVDVMCKTLRSIGKYTIEDCTQCLYSSFSRSQSDYIVGSIRKWTGTPDGGFAVSRKDHFSQKPNQTDMTLELAKVKASYYKYRFIFEKEGDKEEMLAMYRQAEELLANQTEVFAISEMSVRVQANLDVKNLIHKRRENFITLYQLLQGLIKPLFELDENATPLYFPILVGDRISLQKHLVNNAIYAPVVWPKDEHQPRQCEGAEYAYQHLLCIPIDQRYNTDDMNRIVSVINKYYNV